MAIPTICPECGSELTVTRSGLVGPDSETTVDCPACPYAEAFT